MFFISLQVRKPIKIQRKFGKARTDAYFQRLPTLHKAAEDLHTITGAHTQVKVRPVWPKGKTLDYKSPGFPEETVAATAAANVSEEKQTQTSPSSATGTLDFPAATPVPLLSVAAPRKPIKPKLNDKECQVCHILYRTEEDMANPPNNYWLGCSVKNCRFWVHAACIGVYYPNTPAGKKEYDQVMNIIPVHNVLIVRIHVLKTSCLLLILTCIFLVWNLLYFRADITGHELQIC